MDESSKKSINELDANDMPTVNEKQLWKQFRKWSLDKHSKVPKDALCFFPFLIGEVYLEN